MKFLLIFLSFLFILNSCDDPKKDQELKQRELTLFNKEKEFAEKEQDYAQLKMMRDSLQSIPDTLIVNQLPAVILGRWNGKMVCTESNCSDYVIGDLRSDIWEISKDSVKIINKTGAVRMYSSKFDGLSLKLNSDKNLSQNSKSEITLQLPVETLGRMKGNREIIRDNCSSKFSVDLEKIKN